MSSKKKFSIVEADDHMRSSRAGAIDLQYGKIPKMQLKPRDLPSSMKLKKGKSSGAFFGLEKDGKKKYFIGMPEGADGNLIVIGGNGSGKSRGIAMPTLETWRGAICATDIKGELSAQYDSMLRQGIATRPSIVFDPTRIESPSYDPFWWLMTDDPTNVVANIWDIARAIIPLSPEEKQPFWTQSEQGLFAAALLYFFEHGLSFPQSMCCIVSKPASDLAAKLWQSSDVRVRMILGEVSDMKDETIACIDRGLRNKLMLLAVDPQISHALRGQREGANCFTWDDLRTHQVFLRIPAYRVEQYAGMINLMYEQLFHYLERRPEQYTPEADEHPQLLLLLDEFARFGKLNAMTAVLSTLRSKKVNICLFVQSIAQIDRFYGAEDRRIIFDNCQWQVVLRANDPETQEFISKCIGTSVYRQHSIAKQCDRDHKKTGYSLHISETQDWIVAPHELSTLGDVLLLTPDGFFRVDKHLMIPKSRAKESKACTDEKLGINDDIQLCGKQNGGTTMKTITERTQDATKQLQKSELQQRKAERQARDEQNKKDKQRIFFIGKLVLQYFPALREIELSNSEQENRGRFQDFIAILSLLAESPEVIDWLLDESAQRCGVSITADV